MPMERDRRSCTSAPTLPRRSFLAGVATLPVLAAIPAAAATIAGPNDTRLLELADAYEALDRRCDEHTAAHRHLTGEAMKAADDAFDIMVEGYGPIEEEVAATPADSLIGVMAKARVCQIPTARCCAAFEHVLSAVDDLHRILGGHHA